MTFGLVRHLSTGFDDYLLYIVIVPVAHVRICSKHELFSILEYAIHHVHGISVFLRTGTVIKTGIIQDLTSIKIKAIKIK